MNWKDHIISDKAILAGKPIIKNSRLSVELVLDLLAGGWTEKMIMESYPYLTEQDMKAVFAFLREGVENELYLPLPKSA